MLTLDKEIAEQKAEELENELTIVKEELDILKTDVALAEEEKKSRAELLSQNGGDGMLQLYSLMFNYPVRHK